MAFIDENPAMIQAAYVTGDVSAVLVAIATLTEVLPPIAAFLSAVYMGIRIWETCTVRNFIRRIKRIAQQPCKEE